MHKSLLVILVLSVGCGSSSSDSAQCASFTPCGGSPVGTWRITAFCSTPQTSAPNGSTCSDAAIGIHNIQLTGTANFASSGTYSIATTSTGTMDITYPSSCLSAGNTSCAKLQTVMTPTNPSASCVSNAAGDCTCDMAINGTSTEQGTYTTSGSSITMVKTGSTATPDDVSEFCVQGNTLTLHAADTTNSVSVTMAMTRQ